MVKYQDAVTNRVAGFKCRHVFTDHKQAVSAMAVVGRSAGFGGPYLVGFATDCAIGDL